MLKRSSIAALTVAMLVHAGNAVAQSKVATVPYLNGSQSRNGWASATMQVEYQPKVCSGGVIWVILGSRPQTLTYTEPYWFEGKAYRKADLPEPNYDFNSLQVDGDLMRPPNVRVTTVSKSTSDVFDSGCYNAVNWYDTGLKIGNLVGPNATAQQEVAYLRSLYLVPRAVQALTSYSIESHIKWEAQKAKAAAERAERDRVAREAQEQRERDAEAARQADAARRAEAARRSPTVTTTPGAQQQGSTQRSSGTSATAAQADQQRRQQQADEQRRQQQAEEQRRQQQAEEQQRIAAAEEQLRQQKAEEAAQREEERKKSQDELKGMTGTIVGDAIKEGHRVGLVWQSATTEVCPFLSTTCVPRKDYSTIGILFGIGDVSYMQLSGSPALLGNLLASTKEEADAAMNSEEPFVYSFSFMLGWNFLDVAKDDDEGFWPLLNLGVSMGGEETDYIVGGGFGIRIFGADMLMTLSPMKTLTLSTGLAFKF